MHVTKRLGLGLGTAALSLALVGSVAAAALPPADTQTRDEKGKPPTTKLEELLGKLVAEGKLSAEQSATIIARLKEASGKAEGKRPAFHWKGALGDHLNAVASFLGMTRRELAAALREGKSLSDLATAKGKTRADLIAAIAGPANAKVDGALAAGKIDAEQAAKAKAAIAKQVEMLVDRKHDAKPAPKKHEKKERSGPAKPKTP